MNLKKVNREKEAMLLHQLLYDCYDLSFFAEGLIIRYTKIFKTEKDEKMSWCWIALPITNSKVSFSRLILGDDYLEACRNIIKGDLL